MSQIEQVQIEYQQFIEPFQSLILSTANDKGLPNASYAPFVMDEAKNFYIYVSGLSTHTRNLSSNPVASVLFIEDEGKSEQIFARRRLTFECDASAIARETQQWQKIVEQFQTRFGQIIEAFRGLPDFRVFQLTPKNGRFVVGFGAAYNIRQDDLNQLVPISGGGHGKKQE